MDTRLGKRPGVDRPNNNSGSRGRQRVSGITSVPVGEDTDDVTDNSSSSTTNTTDTTSTTSRDNVARSLATLVLEPSAAKVKRMRGRVSGKNERLAKKSRLFVHDGELAAAQIVYVFMEKFVTRNQVTRVLAMRTLSPSPNGMSFDIALQLGHDKYMKRLHSTGTIQAMTRFLCHSGLYQKSVFGSIHMTSVSANLLNCIDVCANPEEYEQLGPAAIMFKEMLRTANVIRETFDLCRTSVVRRVFPWTATSICRTQRERYSIDLFCERFYKQFVVFYTAVSAWRRANSGEFKNRCGIFLCNLYDAQTELRKGIQANMGSCLRMPYLHLELLEFEKRSLLMEQRFLSKAATFSGSYLLSEIKNEYLQKGGVLHTTATVQKPGPGCGDSVMSQLVQSHRGSVSYQYETVHHESVVDLSFCIKSPYFQIDDAYVLKAIGFRDVGYVEHLRRGTGGVRKLSSIYRYVQELISRFRDHLEKVGFHMKRGFVINALSDARWKSFIDGGNMQWCDVIKMLKTCAHAIQFAVGSDDARLVLYTQRELKRTQDTNATCDFLTRSGARNVSQTSCSGEVGSILCQPGLYENVLSAASKLACENRAELGMIILRGNSKKTAFQTYGDSPNCALEPEEYDALLNRITKLSSAELVCDSCDLALLAIDTLIDLDKTLSILDVRLSNAEINTIRSKTLQAKVEREQGSFDGWFQQGLGTNNTLSWLNQEILSRPVHALVSIDAGFTDIHRVVFNGYVSLVTGEGMLEVSEEKYPELLLLDIAYIQDARSAFYGLAIQAAVLVLVGKRLTEMSVPSYAIKCCLDRLSVDPAFTSIRQPETCRAAVGTIQDLHAAILDIVTSAVEDNHVDVKRISYASLLQEVSIEVSHEGYPSSPVASYLARKWSTAMRKGLAAAGTGTTYPHLESVTVVNLQNKKEIYSNDDFETSYLNALSSEFRSLEATQVAFCLEFMLPKAALCLSREIHSSVTTMVKRTWFNTAVHLRKYKDLLSQTV